MNCLMSNISHRGQIVKEAVKSSGINISELSRKLNICRKTVYNIFEKEMVSLEYLKMIGFILNFDFSKKIPELQNDSLLIENDMLWKDKYISLLEEYNQLLKLFYKIN